MEQEIYTGKEHSLSINGVEMIKQDGFMYKGLQTEAFVLAKELSIVITIPLCHREVLSTNVNQQLCLYTLR